MANELPSSTPEKPSDNEAAANAADNQGKDNPKEKIRPRRRKPTKWLGLTEAKRRELLAIVMLIPWVWVDIIDSHNFTKLCLLAISLAVAQYVSLSFFKNYWKGWALAIWLVSLIPLAVVVWENSRPILEPEPHFSFSLVDPITADVQLPLTNAIFETKVFGAIRPHLMGFVLIPVKDEANVDLRIGVLNDGQRDAGHTEIMLSFPENMVCVPESGWQITKSENMYGTPNSTNKMNTVQFNIPEILLGNSAVLPTLHFSHFPIIKMGEVQNPAIVFITSRSAGAPAGGLNFALNFLPVISNASAMNPVAIPGSWVTNEAGKQMIPFPPAFINEMKR